MRSSHYLRYRSVIASHRLKAWDINENLGQCSLHFPIASFSTFTTLRQEASKSVSMDTIWSLWNEGNLFSLSQGELEAFLSAQKANFTSGEKKTALVRKVEEVMSVSQPSLVKQDDSAISLFDAESGSASSSDLFEEADVYGDWGPDPSFENKIAVDFIERSVDAQVTELQGAMDVRATQLLHEDFSADIRLLPLKKSKLPGHFDNKQAFTIGKSNAIESNQQRFVRSCSWAINNMWNMGHEGNINATFGRTLIKNIQQAVVFKKSVVPIWSAQKAMAEPKCVRFVALAHENNTEAIGQFLKKNGFVVEKEATTSYLVMIRRPRDPIVLELDSNLQPLEVLRSWDRHLVTQYIRGKMPDVRFMIRGRTPLKKRIASPYYEAEVLKFKNDTVESVLAPELGDIQYVAERAIASWNTFDAETGLNIRMLQTKRTPVLTTNNCNQGERLEYELLAAIPPKEKTDASAIASKIYDFAVSFAKLLEPGMEEFKCEGVVG